MKTRFFRHIGVALTSALVLSSLALTPIGAPIPAQAAITSVSIDTSSKTSVQNAYINVYLPNVAVANGWTGNASDCMTNNGSQEARDATVNVINYFRALAGLNPVTENATASEQAGQAALVMAANSNLSHNPPSDWKCMNPIAAASAGESNLSMGNGSSALSIAGYMSDPGSGNVDVGHRRWVLYPVQSQVGIGMAGNAYALQLWGLSGMQANDRTNEAVPWPTEGYFPSQNLPASSRWSYSAPNVDFDSGSGTTVTVTKNGASLPVSVISSNAPYGDSTLVWSMPQIVPPAVNQVDTYTVKISGAVDATYDVKVFTPIPPCSFTDVPKTHLFYDSICWLSTTGITKGTGDGTTYSPSKAVNRGSMAAFLYRLAGSPEWTPPATSPFVDVPTTHLFYSSITWLYNQGVTVGVTIGGKLYYQPDNAVNRGSMSAFMYRIADKPEWTAPATSQFTDIKSNQFYGSITWLASEKITVGSTVNGKLVYQPTNPVNRGSMAAFMNRLAKTQLQCTRYETAIGC